MCLRVFILVIWFTLATYPGKQWHVSIFYWLMTHPAYLNPSGFSVWVFVLWDSYDGCSTVPCRLSYEQVYVRVRKIDASNLTIVDKMRSIDRSLRWLGLPARQKIWLFLRYFKFDYTSITPSGLCQVGQLKSWCILAVMIWGFVWNFFLCVQFITDHTIVSSR